MRRLICTFVLFAYGIRHIFSWPGSNIFIFPYQMFFILVHEGRSPLTSAPPAPNLTVIIIHSVDEFPWYKPRHLWFKCTLILIFDMQFYTRSDYSWVNILGFLRLHFRKTDHLRIHHSRHQNLLWWIFMSCSFIAMTMESSIWHQVKKAWVVVISYPSWHDLSTVNVLNVRIPQTIVVVTLKFELYGCTIE